MPKAYWVVTYRSVSDPQKRPAYQEALKVLGDGVVRDVRIVEGVE